MGLRYVALVVLLVCAGCGSRADEAASPRLYLAGDGELWIVETGEPRARRLAMEELGPGDPPYRIVARRDRLVLAGAPPFAVDGGLAARRSFDGSFFIPSSVPDRLWLIRLEGRRSWVRSVREMTVGGDVTVPDARPPGGRWPLAAVGDGLLVEDGRGGIAVWDAAARRIVRRLDIDPSRFGTAGGDLVASCADEPCRALQLTDARTGRSRALAAPGGARFEPWHAAFSPDGRRLGIAVRDAGGWSAPRRLALIDLDAGGTAVVPGSTVPGGYTFVVWSPSGDHVFITGGDRFEPRTLVGYRLGAPRAQTIDVEVGDFYGAAAL